MSQQFWDSFNHTELYQTCRNAGLPATPDMPRETLGKLLEGYITTGGENPLDAWRDALMLFIIDFWDKLQSQISCPAKSKDPKACYGCLDTQVVACLTKNPRVLTEIRRRKKK